ncbi:MAG: amidohydrolase family protein [Gordonia sp. (in: high G+C Gram-positive bacteria)]
MGRTVIRGGSVVTMDPDAPYFADGTVVVKGNRIVWIGATADHISRAGDIEIDASRAVVLPGLVNLHYHTDLGKAAGESNERKPMWDLLFDDWYPFLGQLTDEEAYWAAMASYAESVRNGTTTLNDMYVQSAARARAAREIGVRTVLSNEIATAETGIDTVADNIAACESIGGAPGDLIRIFFGIEWLPCATPGILSEVREAATEFGTGIHIHLNESISEVEDSLERFGKRPAQLAYDLGFFGPDVVAAHCVHLDDVEIRYLAEAGTHISHNPASNSYLGNGIARANDFRSAGINVGLGSDEGFGSDLFEVMRWASYLHRATSRDIYARTSAESLIMATVNGSRALGQETGILRSGLIADLILVDVDQVKFAMMDRSRGDEVVEFMVNQACGADVSLSMIDGEIVMRGRRLTKVDETEIFENAGRALRNAGARIAATN